MIFEYLKIKGWTEQKVHYYGHTRSYSQIGSAISSLIAGFIYDGIFNAYYAAIYGPFNPLNDERPIIYFTVITMAIGVTVLRAIVAIGFFFIGESLPKEKNKLKTK